MVDKKLLSKSSVNLYLQCPYKWKKSYVDEVRIIASPAQERGTRIHKKIENFYKNPKADLELKNFINFEMRRIKDMVKENKFEKKYFYPLFQELKLSNDKLGLKGIVDAVFINPKDDKLIVIDWKTGKYYENDIDNYRLELVIYKLLLENSGLVDEKVGYWGIYFTDQDKLFFESVDDNKENVCLATIMEARRGIEMESYHPKKNKWCFNCQFRKECGI
jgi:CRISPR/Cas system-associated exonuclease Cas4 (RecB family)